VLAPQPKFVQIISWNDYGESHYVGPAPARAAGYEAFERGLSPFNYALNMPHDGWWLTLPYWIDMYKTGTTSVTREGVSAWYRQAPGLACPSGGTTGNTATQLQFTHPPEKILRDKVFFDAVLGSAADVTVTIGGANANAKWENIPDGNVGVYHGSVDFGGRTGAVVVRITRGGATVVEMTGEPIRGTCANAMQNWNPWVGSKQAAGTIDARSPPADSLKHCVDGRGLGFYADLCDNACQNDYCPPVYTCTALASKPRTHPGWVDVHACPADGFDRSFVGLCSMTCAIKVNYCSPSSCAVKPAGYVCPVLDPKDPLIPKCIAGTAGDKWKGLCEFGCAHNMCPPDICMCTEVSYVGPPGPVYDETVTGKSLAARTLASATGPASTASATTRSVSGSRPFSCRAPSWASGQPAWICKTPAFPTRSRPSGTRSVPRTYSKVCCFLCLPSFDKG
jgi:glycosyl hydrolase family 71